MRIFFDLNKSTIFVNSVFEKITKTRSFRMFRVLKKGSNIKLPPF